MYKRVLMLSTLLIIVVVILSLKMVTDWGRRYVYSVENGSIAPGYGKKFTDYAAMYSLESRDFKRIVIDAKDLDKYDKDEYSLTYIPPQNILQYAVGKVVGLENISDSDDIYIVLDDSSGVTSKYRVVLNNTSMYSSKSWSQTSLGVERISRVDQKDLGTIYLKNGLIKKYGFSVLKAVVKEGDVVAVLPKEDNLKRSVSDDLGNYIVGTLVVRRFFGLPELEFNLILFK